MATNGLRVRKLRQAREDVSIREWLTADVLSMHILQRNGDGSMEIIHGGKTDEAVAELGATTGYGPFSKFNTPASPILFPVGERRVGWEMRNGAFQRTNSHKAIIRLNQKGDNAQLLNIVGANYKIVHNRELFHIVEEAMTNQMLPEHLKDVHVTDKVAGFGRVCFREYVFPSIRCRIPSARSDIGFRIIVQNGYGGSALRIHTGAIDFYCSNGMIRGEYVSAYKKHSSRLVVTGLDNLVTKALMQFTESEVVWQRWVRTGVQHAAAMALFEKIAESAKMKEGLLEQYEREQDARGKNLWSVYSTLTYYASHADGAFNFRRTVDEQDTKASIMLKRELAVSRWTQSPEWQALETVT